MNRDCEILQQALVEVAGAAENLGEKQQEHLGSCATCRSVATREAALGELLDAARPAEDPALQERILLAVAERRSRRKWLAALPVAASLALAFLGVTILGGVPAGGLAARIPAWSGSGLLALIRSCADFFLALGAAWGVLADLITTPWSVIAGASGLAGAAGLVSWSRRWDVQLRCAVRS